MATIEFNQVITDEAVTYARFASTNSGWFLKPKRWAITTASGELTTSRTTSSMYNAWITQPFSGSYESGANKLLHSLVIPPDAYATDMNIGEIYFIYEDYYGNEFLYAIAQPKSSLIFNVGVSQSYTFVFTLNNTTVADTFVIEYTYPQDIEDHNKKPDVHTNLLAVNGSRKPTNILSYSEKLTFNNARNIVDKEYVDTQDNTVKKLVTDLDDKINTTYCPIGSLMWWPKSTAPTGWLIRDGRALSRTTYAKLFAVIGTTYGAGNGSTTFNLPDDRGQFIRGYKSGLSANFGQLQPGGLPNITGAFGANEAYADREYASGAFYVQATGNRLGTGDSDSDNHTIQFNASRSNKLYGAANEVRPINRNYLPIIRAI